MSKEHYETAGVPKRHKDFRPDQTVSAPWLTAYESLKTKIESGSILAVVGNRGSGKTQIGACLIGYCAYKLNLSCMYRKTLDIFLRIRESFRLEGDSEKMAIEEFLRPFLLVIDAYEVRSDSDFENRILDHLIDKRYDDLKSTVIISNDTPESFEKQIGPSICDRIRETGAVAVMNWQSFRNKTA